MLKNPLAAHWNRVQCPRAAAGALRAVMVSLVATGAITMNACQRSDVSPSVSEHAGSLESNGSDQASLAPALTVVPPVEPEAPTAQDKMGPESSPSITTLAALAGPPPEPSAAERGTAGAPVAGAADSTAARVAAPPSAPAAASEEPQPSAPPATPRPLAPFFEGEPARAAFLAGRWNEAAAGFAALALVGDSRSHHARLLEAIARLEAGDAGVAARFEALIPTAGALEPMVRVFAAEARLAADESEAALGALGTFDFAGHPEARSAAVARARAHTKLGHVAAAAAAWREIIGRHDRHDAASVEAADAIARLGADATRETARILRGVLARSPHSEAAIAAQTRLDTLPKALSALTLDELIIRLEAQVARRAIAAAEETAQQIARSARSGSDVACKAALVEARGLDNAKKRRAFVKRDAALSAGCAVTVTASPERRAAAAEIAYLAGKAQRASGTRPAAIDRFGAAADLDPSSRFADDALVAQAALLRLDHRDRAAAIALERAMAMSGDQSEAAAFDLFWSYYTAGQFDRAAATSKKAVDTLPPGELLRSRGRLPYWYARTLEQRGDMVQATVGYAAVVQRYPLTWYSLLARSRLAGLDPGALAAADRAAHQGTPSQSLAEQFATALATPAVERAVTLLRLDLKRPGKEALEAATADLQDGAWLEAYVYDQIGDPAAAYHIARWEQPEHTATFPVAGAEDRWRIANPRPSAFQDAVTRAAQTQGIEPAYVWAIMQTESGFRPEVVSGANAVGLMQLIIPTGRAMAKREGLVESVGLAELKRPDLNIRLGVRYLARLEQRLGAHLPLMAAGYNAGPGRPLQWLERQPIQDLDTFVENIPYKETRRYVKSVMTAYVRYRYLYEGLDAPPLPLTLSPG